jgi:hypothetical protein
MQLCPYFPIAHFEFFLFGYEIGDMWVIGDPCQLILLNWMA